MVFLGILPIRIFMKYFVRYNAQIGGLICQEANGMSEGSKKVAVLVAVGIVVLVAWCGGAFGKPIVAGEHDEELPPLRTSSSRTTPSVVVRSEAVMSCHDEGGAGGVGMVCRATDVAGKPVPSQWICPPGYEIRVAYSSDEAGGLRGEIFCLAPGFPAVQPSVPAPPRERPFTK